MRSIQRSRVILIEVLLSFNLRENTSLENSSAFWLLIFSEQPWRQLFCEMKMHWSLFKALSIIGHGHRLGSQKTHLYAETHKWAQWPSLSASICSADKCLHWVRRKDWEGSGEMQSRARGQPSAPCSPQSHSWVFWPQLDSSVSCRATGSENRNKEFGTVFHQHWEWNFS